MSALIRAIPDRRDGVAGGVGGAPLHLSKDQGRLHPAPRNRFATAPTDPSACSITTSARGPRPGTTTLPYVWTTTAKQIPRIDRHLATESASHDTSRLGSGSPDERQPSGHY